MLDKLKAIREALVLCHRWTEAPDARSAGDKALAELDALIAEQEKVSFYSVSILASSGQPIESELVEALRFYANPDNYHATEPGMPCCMAMDEGRRAHAALASQGKEASNG